MCIGSAVRADEPPEALGRAARAVFDARKRVTSTELTLEVNHVNTNSDVVHTYRQALWLNKNLARIDLTTIKRTPSDPEEAGLRKVRCRDGVRKGYTAFASILEGRPRAVRFVANKPTDPVQKQLNTPWPLLGLRNDALAQYTEGGPFPPLLRTDGAYPGRVRAEAIDKPGETRYIGVQTREQDGGKYHIRDAVVFDADQGGSITLIEERVKEASGTIEYVQSVTVEHQLVKPAGLWFPKTITYRNGTTSDDMGVVETIRLTGVKINEPIADGVFDLPAFGLIDGSVIEYPDVKSKFDWPVWRNGKADSTFTYNDILVPYVPPGQEHPELPPATAGHPIPDAAPGVWSQPWVYVAAAGVLAVAGVLLLRKRRKPT
jgi:hypothetical protein